MHTHARTDLSLVPLPGTMPANQPNRPARRKDSALRRLAFGRTRLFGTAPRQSVALRRARLTSLRGNAFAGIASILLATLIVLLVDARLAHARSGQEIETAGERASSSSPLPVPFFTYDPPGQSLAYAESARLQELYLIPGRPARLLARAGEEVHADMLATWLESGGYIIVGDPCAILQLRHVLGLSPWDAASRRIITLRAFLSTRASGALAASRP